MDAELAQTVIMQRGKVNIFKSLATEMPDKFKYVCAADMAKEDSELTVFGRIGGMGMDLVIVDDDLMKITVDPVRPSRHRSRRILKKLRKRLGEPYKQDYAVFLQGKIREAFYLEPKFLMEPAPESTFYMLQKRMAWESLKKVLV